LQAQHSKTGRTLAALDFLIAATALVHDLDLVTRNLRDHENPGIEILNPWAG